MYLVEGVGFKNPLVGCPNEDLKPQGLVFHVAMELGEGREKIKSNDYTTIDMQGMAAIVQQTKRSEKLLGSRKNTELWHCLEEWRIGSNLDVQPEGTASINYRNLF